jgi:hypothetical protein
MSKLPSLVPWLFWKVAALPGSVWRTQSPSKVAFFVRSMALSKILSLDNLRKRHVIVMDKYCMCKRNEEFVDRLLFHCDVVSVIWSVLFNHFGMSCVMPRCVIDLYDCWWFSGRSRSTVVWKMVHMCLFWCLWKEINDRNFEDMERSMGDIIYMFF